MLRPVDRIRDLLAEVTCSHNQASLRQRADDLRVEHVAMVTADYRVVLQRLLQRGVSHVQGMGANAISR